MSESIVDRMRLAFQSEAVELLAELDAALLALETEPANREFVNRVFRAIHTIKGSGATAGLTHLAAVAHKVEEAFDLARAGRLAITGALVDCGLKACDVLRAVLGAENPNAVSPGEEDVARRLAELIPATPAKAEGSGDAVVGGNDTGRTMAYEVVARPKRELFYSGAEPITLLDELRALGQAHIEARTDSVPLFFELDPESCYLWWELKLVTDRGEKAIRDVFTFVEEDCEVTIRALDDQSSAVAFLGNIPAESLQLFAAECQDHLDSIEGLALALESDRSPRESVDALFRAVHSIKGNAGLLLGQAPAESLAKAHPLPALARLAHAVESCLEPHRQPGGPPVGPEKVALLLEARDSMQGLLGAVTGRANEYFTPQHLLEQLGLAADDGVSAHASTSAFRNTAVQCLEVGQNCLAQIDRGEFARPVLKVYERSLKTLRSAAAYQKRSDLDEAIGAQLRILDHAIRTGGPLTREQRSELGESLRRARSVAAANPASETGTSAAARPVSAVSTTVRIDQEKLDRLMRVVGELLVAKGSIPAVVQKLSEGEDRAVVTRMLKDAGASISHIAEELQASVMSIRMLPMKTVFQRFPRLVRDLARSLGKEVELVVEGEGVELDKTILEQIGDPLVHLVRNAVDHGIESPEDREARGKARSGRVLLRASNDSGNVTIEVADDGRGLDAQKLKRKAVEKALIAPEAASALSHADACRLVFLPGLSTADKVTEVSGRGVGMDVVSNNIRALQGTIDIGSTAGAGTRFSIKLPTSLIVSKGILLEAGGQEYILPLGSIRDMVKVPATQIRTYKGQKLTQIRGEVYALISLAESFGLPVADAPEAPIAVIDSGKTRYGLIADRFLSEVEVLVKPLAGGLEGCREFHGAAIMGDGRVVLVLNPLECHRGKAAGVR